MTETSLAKPVAVQYSNIRDEKIMNVRTVRRDIESHG
jgi:hypothetical protein